MTQWRMVAALCLLAVTGATAQQNPPAQRPMQADGVVRLLSDLENALMANDQDAFIRLTSAGMATAETVAFMRASFGDGQTTAAVRERDRQPTGDGFTVLADMLLGRGRVGRIAAWQLLVAPDGEAPYPNFTLAALDAELPSGHSPAYFAIWNQPTLPTTLSWRDDPVALNGHPFFFLAHEVAHQWFGQAIGWKNYHEQWLSEGLAQYFAALYAIHDRGNDTERQLFSQMRDSAMDLSRHGPVHLGYRLGHVQGDGRIFRGLVYNKSAVVLHMLRRLIGDDAFARGIRRFYQDHRFGKAGTGDLRAAFEAGTDVSLERFFDRWIHGFTLPQARLSWRDDPTGSQVVVRVEQSGDVFDFPLAVTVDYRDGRSEVVDLAVTSAVHEVRLPVSGPVRRVEVRNNLSLVTITR